MPIIPGTYNSAQTNESGIICHNGGETLAYSIIVIIIKINAFFLHKNCSDIEPSTTFLQMSRLIYFKITFTNDLPLTPTAKPRFNEVLVSQKILLQYRVFCSNPKIFYFVHRYSKLMHLILKA